jgi:hypothetical protein
LYAGIAGTHIKAGAAMDKPEYLIFNYVHGKYGYKYFFELRQWNPVYKNYFCTKEALRLQFIADYCLLHHIDYEKIKIIEV